LADEKYYNVLVDSILLPVQKASPHMEWIAQEAIMLTGQYDKGLLRMKQRYESQVNNKDLTTLYEKFDDKKPGTPNHAWNAPNYVLSHYIAGIKATDVAWKSYEVKPNLAHLTYVKQIVPSVKGDIAVEVNKSKDTYSIDLISPKQTTATIYVPKAGKKVSQLLVNGKNVWKNNKFKNQVKGFKYESEDSNYLIFKAVPGKWSIVSKYK